MSNKFNSFLRVFQFYLKKLKILENIFINVIYSVMPGMQKGKQNLLLYILENIVFTNITNF